MTQVRLLAASAATLLLAGSVWAQAAPGERPSSPQESQSSSPAAPGAFPAGNLTLGDIFVSGTTPNSVVPASFQANAAPVLPYLRRYAGRTETEQSAEQNELVRLAWHLVRSGDQRGAQILAAHVLRTDPANAEAREIIMVSGGQRPTRTGPPGGATDDSCPLPSATAAQPAFFGAGCLEEIVRQPSFTLPGNVKPARADGVCCEADVCPLAKFAAAKSGDSACSNQAECCIERKLSEPISLNVKNQALWRLAADLSELTGINIIIDKPALCDAGICLQQSVSFWAEKTPLNTVLSHVLGRANLGYQVKNGSVAITTKDKCVCQPPTGATTAAGSVQTYSIQPGCTPVEARNGCNLTPSEAHPLSIRLMVPMKNAAGATTLVPVQLPFAYQGGTFAYPPTAAQSLPLMSAAQLAQCQVECGTTPAVRPVPPPPVRSIVGLPSHVRISAKKNQIEIAGPGFEAVCDSLQILEGGKVRLEGKVEVNFNPLVPAGTSTPDLTVPLKTSGFDYSPPFMGSSGTMMTPPASIRAERLTFGLNEGNVAINPVTFVDSGTAATTMAPRTVTQPAAVTVLTPAGHKFPDKEPFPPTTGSRPFGPMPMSLPWTPSQSR